MAVAITSGAVVRLMLSAVRGTWVTTDDAVVIAAILMLLGVAFGVAAR